MHTANDDPPIGRPLMLFDGACGLCRVIVERWQTATGDRILFVAFQDAREWQEKIGEKQLQRAVHFVDADGRVARGAEAVFRAAAACGRKRWLAWLYRWLPPFAWLAELAYRLVAGNRTAIAAVRRAWYGKDLKLPTYHVASAMFLRLLGVVYFIAFVSLWTQIDGLIGDHGILPAGDYLNLVEKNAALRNPPVSAVWNVPTLAWISPHNGLLQGLCAAGTVCAVMLVCGVLPMAALVAMWLSYLSLLHVGQDFLSFQWDILLLETGAIAIFMAPRGMRSRFIGDRHPPRLAIWLAWWLLFRLMLESGAVKLSWNDGTGASNTWESLTALDYHYWTQPLPMRTSWYMAQLPAWFHKLSIIVVLVVELMFPLLIWAPRRFRYAAFWGIALLMLLIGVTGNYNFFNLLTVAMAVTLLDDKAWPGWLRRRITGTDWPGLFSPTRWRMALLLPLAGLAAVLGSLQLKDSVAPSETPDRPLEYEWNIAQFFLVNDYGLFRRMTETRPEIVIEGSDNGTDWKAYEFRWKPGDVSRPPGFNTPHQPRLDWQMWFEALRLEQVYAAAGTIDLQYASPWFQSLVVKLLKNEPAVVGLLKPNPFAKDAPRYLRVALYQYRFTDWAEGRRTGDWWRRELVWLGPAMSLGL